MNCKTLCLQLAVLNLAWVAAAAAPLGTSFTYQGRLSDGLDPAHGSYDLTFALYDVASGGSRVGGPLTNAVAISNGLFVLALEFGDGVFSGEARWLEIGVRTNGAVTDFKILDPRQPVLPVPYAIYASGAGSLLSF